MTTNHDYLIQGFTYLTHKGLKRFVFIPIFINFILFILLFALGMHYFHSFINWINHITPHWLHWLDWILWPLFFLTSAIILLYTFTIIANIIAAPFNSFLSEKVELLITGKRPDTPEGIWAGIQDLPRVLGREILKIRYYLPRLAMLSLIYFIPGLNVIAPIAWFIFGCWMMAMQYVDYPMDNHRVEFEKMYRGMLRQPFKYWLFGASITIAMMIPIVNLFVIPASVIGATLMYVNDSKLKTIPLPS